MVICDLPIVDSYSTHVGIQEGGGWTPREYGQTGGYNFNLSSIFPGTFDHITCSNSIEELLQGYRNYVPLWQSSVGHYLCGVRSQMNLCGWRNILMGGPNSVYGPGGMDPDTHFLLDSMIHGFKLLDPRAKIHGYYCNNYESATVTTIDKIDIIFKTELAAGKLSVVQEQPMCIHAMGAVPKSSGGFRPITVVLFTSHSHSHYGYSEYFTYVIVLFRAVVGGRGGS